MTNILKMFSVYDFLVAYNEVTCYLFIGTFHLQ